jgi:hypothetical protein
LIVSKNEGYLTRLESSHCRRSRSRTALSGGGGVRGDDTMSKSNASARHPQLNRYSRFVNCQVSSRILYLRPSVVHLSYRIDRIKLTSRGRRGMTICCIRVTSLINPRRSILVVKVAREIPTQPSSIVCDCGPGSWCDDIKTVVIDCLEQERCVHSCGFPLIRIQRVSRPIKVPWHCRVFKRGEIVIESVDNE